jgi:hypothetical protein
VKQTTTPSATTTFDHVSLFDPFPIELDINHNIWLILPIRITIYIFKPLEFLKGILGWRNGSKSPLCTTVLIAIP